MVQLWSSFADLLPYAAPLALVAFAALIVWPRLSPRAQPAVRRVFLGAWIVVLLLVTMQPEPGVMDVDGVIHRRTLSIMPFHDLARLGLESAGSSVLVSQMAGNLILFMPLGLYLRLDHRTRRWSSLRVFLAGIAAGAAVEAAQWIAATGRVTSTDDALLAGLGTALGFVLLEPLARVRRPPVADREGRGDRAAQPGS